MVVEWKEKMAKQHFMEAVEDAEIRMRLFQVGPDTLEQAIAVALETENFSRMEDRRGFLTRPPKVREVVVKTDEKFHAMERKIEDVTSQLAALGRQDDRTTQTMGNVRMVTGDPEDSRWDKRFETLENQISKLTRLIQGQSQGHQKKRKDIKDVECYTCHLLGHYSSDCPERKEHQGNGTRLSKGSNAQ
jgi:hypothetical protein